MKHNMQYTDSENLTFFLDGELAVENEAILLESVNSDEELLRQYREESAMKSATRSDMGAIPPPELKNELFSKLGYGSKTKPVPVAPMPHFKKYVVAAAVLMLTTTSMLLYNLNDNTENSANTNAVSIAPVETSMAIESDQTTDTDNTVVKETAKMSNNNARSSEKYAGISAEKNNTEKSKASNLASNRASGVNTTKVNVTAIKDEGTAIAAIAHIINNCFMIDKSCLNPIAIQFANFDGLINSNNTLTMNPQQFKSAGSNSEIGKNELHAQGLNVQQSNDFLINGSFALAYFRNWNGRISVGLEGAYENINKVVFNEDTQTFESPELANATSISALVRYDEFALSMFNIHPFVQCQVGLSLNANYVYGGSVGLKYSPMYSRFGLQASYNYKAFQYYYGGTSSNSEVFDKNGLAISLIYRF